MQKEIKKEIGIKIAKQAKARDSKKLKNLNLIVLVFMKKIIKNKLFFKNLFFKFFNIIIILGQNA